MNMFKIKCARCGKEMFTYAKSKTGELKMAYCSKACESNDKYEKRFVKLK